MAPQKLTPTTQLSGGIFLDGAHTEMKGAFMPKALEAKPSGPPPKDPYPQLFLPLIVVVLFNCF